MNWIKNSFNFLNGNSLGIVVRLSIFFLFLQLISLQPPRRSSLQCLELADINGLICINIFNWMRRRRRKACWCLWTFPGWFFFFLRFAGGSHGCRSRCLIRFAIALQLNSFSALPTRVLPPLRPEMHNCILSAHKQRQRVQNFAAFPLVSHRKLKLGLKSSLK